MSGRPPIGGSDTTAQSQYERKLARQRQLEMMEATASGTAPTMELDTSRWSTPEDDDHGEMETLNIIQDDYETRRHSTKTRVPGSSSTAGLFRPREDRTAPSSNLNLMDHATGRYSDQPTSFLGRWFGSTSYSSNAFPPSPHHFDASPGEDLYGSDMYGSPSKPRHRRQPRSRLSLCTAICYQTFCTKKNTRRTYAALFAIAASLIIALTILSLKKNESSQSDKRAYDANEDRFQAFYTRFALVENITDANTLDNLDTPEHHALRFMAYTDPGRLKVDDPYASHRYALVVFYYNSFAKRY
jgi:hypothetical protein